MKKVLLSILLTLLPILASADAVEINGIWYNLVPKAKEAEVTKNPNGSKYSGSIEIPASVTYNEVKYIVTSIGDNAFSCCSGLTSVTIPNSVTSIGQGAFFQCRDLISVTIPNSVTSIGQSAFWECSSLTSFTIPNSVTSIGNSAFFGCDNLTSVHISSLEAWCKISFNDNPLIYAKHLYLNGEEVKFLVIPNNINSIGNSTFSCCCSLISVSIPNSVTSIGDGAFGGCSNLASVTIPNSMTSIGDNAFYNCDGLTSITIPNSVTSIGWSAFQNCSGLTSVTIPNSVTFIGSYAFYGCSGLTSVTIPNSVTSIRDDAFSNCWALTSVPIPNSVTSIGESAFYNCDGLTSITIPNSVAYINNQAFASCDMLTDVFCQANQVPSTNPDAFKDSYPQAMTLHVPAASIEAYRSTAPWSQFKPIVALEDGDTPTTQKCATPEISYADGKLDFTCETEGVEFVSEVIVGDAKKYYDASVTLSQTYKVTVYATKAGYENSDVSTREIVIEKDQTTLFGDINKDGKVNVADHVKLSDIIMNNKSTIEVPDINGHVEKPQDDDDF